MRGKSGRTQIVTYRLAVPRLPPGEETGQRTSRVNFTSCVLWGFADDFCVTWVSWQGFYSLETGEGANGSEYKGEFEGDQMHEIIKGYLDKM